MMSCESYSLQAMVEFKRISSKWQHIIPSMGGVGVG